jgi:hypothetical protein
MNAAAIIIVVIAIATTGVLMMRLQQVARVKCHAIRETERPTGVR